MKKSNDYKKIIVLSFFMIFLIFCLFLNSTKVYGSEISDLEYENEKNKISDEKEKNQIDYLSKLSLEKLNNEKIKYEKELEKYNEELNKLKNEEILEEERENALKDIDKFNQKLSDKTYNIVKCLKKEINNPESKIYKYFGLSKTGSRALNGAGVNYAPDINEEIKEKGIVYEYDKISYRLYKNYESNYYTILIKLDDITKYNKNDIMQGIIQYSSDDNTWYIGEAKIIEETVFCLATNKYETYNIIDGGNFAKNRKNINDIINNYESANKKLNEIKKEKSKKEKLNQNINEIIKKINDYNEEIKKRNDEYVKDIIDNNKNNENNKIDNKIVDEISNKTNEKKDKKIKEEIKEVKNEIKESNINKNNSSNIIEKNYNESNINENKNNPKYKEDNKNNNQVDKKLKYKEYILDIIENKKYEFEKKVIVTCSDKPFDEIG